MEEAASIFGPSWRVRRALQAYIPEPACPHANTTKRYTRTRHAASNHFISKAISSVTVLPAHPIRDQLLSTKCISCPKDHRRCCQAERGHEPEGGSAVRLLSKIRSRRRVSSDDGVAPTPSSMGNLGALAAMGRRLRDVRVSPSRQIPWARKVLVVAHVSSRTAIRRWRRRLMLPRK